MATPRRLSPALRAFAVPRGWSLRHLAFGAFGAVLLAVAAVFISLVVSIEGLHHQVDHRHDYVQALETASGVERSVVDLETGLRGFLLTRQPRFLAPYRQAVEALPRELTLLRSTVAGNALQSRRAAALATSIGAYERNYAAPLARTGAQLTQAQIVTTTSDGKRLLDAIRARFSSFGATEEALARHGSAATASSATTALVIASSGFALIVLILAALAAYLQRSILIPVIRVAEAASRGEQGERGGVVPEHGRGEVRSLARSFNAMIEAVAERDRALRIARDRLQGVLDYAGSIIYIKDAQGRYVLVNRAFEQARGLTALEVLGRTERDFSPPEVAERIVADDRTVIERLEPVSAEYKVPTRDGLRTFLSVKFPIPAPHGGQATIGGISTDITEHNEALAAATEASRMKSQFVANMSHEIRTPLSGVIGMTNLLRDTELTPAQREYVGALASSGEALLHVIGDILDFSKIEAGRMDLDPTDFDVRALVEESCLMVAESTHAKGLELSHWVDGEVPEFVSGDRNRLRQVLLNLLSNAVKFTEEGEIVVKVASARGERLVFSVSDTGIGIDSDQTETLFDPFSQADPSTTREHGGTGLGLAICRELVTLMGGQIATEAGPEGGSVFWFTARLPTIASPVRSVRARADVTGLRALIVDDNHTNLTVLRQYLSAWGLVCDALEDPLLALGAFDRAAADGHPYQLAVLDYNMPRMDGLEIAGAIRSRPALANLAIVLLTSSPAENQLAEEAGVTHHLVKPPRQSELYDAIAQAIAGQTPPRTPRVNGASAPSRATADADAPGVLVAEDNEVIQLLATTMLEQRGLNVDLARNGREALEMSRARDYEAIFMDCQMPELDGYEVAARIRSAEDGRPTPIIAMTAHAMPGDRERCLAAGMDDYLSKPIEPEQLDRVLERWLPGHDRCDAHMTSSVEPPAVQAPDVTDAEPLDPQVVDRLKDDLEPWMRERLLDTFAESLHDCLEQIESALQRNDCVELCRAAHLLKGGSATIGARALSEACQALECLAASDAPLTTREAAQLEALGQSTLSALRSRLLEPHVSA